MFVMFSYGFRFTVALGVAPGLYAVLGLCSGHQFVGVAAGFCVALGLYFILGISVWVHDWVLCLVLFCPGSQFGRVAGRWQYWPPVTRGGLFRCRAR